MATKKKTKKKSKPRKIEVERIYDSHDSDVEEHVVPLLNQIGNVKLEKINLSTPETAAEAIPMLDEVIEKLSTYRKAAFTLRQLLEEKRDRESH